MISSPVDRIATLGRGPAITFSFRTVAITLSSPGPIGVPAGTTMSPLRMSSPRRRMFVPDCVAR